MRMLKALVELLDRARGSGNTTALAAIAAQKYGHLVIANENTKRYIGNDEVQTINLAGLDGSKMIGRHYDTHVLVDNFAITEAGHEAIRKYEQVLDEVGHLKAALAIAKAEAALAKKSTVKPERFRLQTDDDGHNYLIPAERAEDWFEWTKWSYVGRLLEMTIEPPQWAERIDSPHSVTFEVPEVG